MIARKLEVTYLPYDRTTRVPPGTTLPARAVIGTEHVLDFDLTVAEPGWTMHMVSHFHYDPVWWNTQAAYTSVWSEDPPGRCRQTTSPAARARRPSPSRRSCAALRTFFGRLERSRRARSQISCSVAVSVFQRCCPLRFLTTSSTV